MIRTPGSPLVWYAAYGSNLSRSRFAAYLTGGPVPHAPRPGRHQRGARNPAPPQADRAVRLDGRVYFAGRSGSWGGGGVAYLDPDAPGQTRSRAWLVTAEQLADVFAQENGVDPGNEPDWTHLFEHGRLLAADRSYSLLLALGSLDGHPVVTFTSPERRSDLAPPHDSYVNVICEGLAEAWHLERPAAESTLGLDRAEYRREA